MKAIVMLASLFLITAISTCFGIVCTPDFKCPLQGECDGENYLRKNCNGRIIENHRFCGCCPICALREGELCFDIPGISNVSPYRCDDARCLPNGQESRCTKQSYDI